MAEISVWQRTIEPSGGLLVPDRLATKLFELSVLLFKALTTHGETDLSSSLVQDLNHQKHRYKLWCSDFDADEGGLDEKVADAEHLRETLLRLLCRIAEALVTMAHQTSLIEDLTDILTQVGDLRSQVSQVTDKNVLDEVNIEDLSSSESECSSQEEVPKTEKTQETLRHIELSINLLCQLGPALYDHAERAATRQDKQKSDERQKEQMLQSRAWPYISLIIESYPQIEQGFARRLGDANENRYNKLMESRLRAATRSSDSETQSSVDQVEPVGRLSPVQSQLMMSQAPSEFTEPSTVLASLFDRPREAPRTMMGSASRVAASVTSFASSLVDEGSSSQRRGIPKLSKDDFAKEAFDCAICGERLSTIREPRQWVKHVYQDLQPYICTFDDCEYGLRPFQSQHKWADHEFLKHRKMPNWSCDICGCELSTELSTKAHILEEHGKLDDAKVDALQQSASNYMATWMRDQKCPFCITFSADAKRKFRSHVGRHLEEVSHAAIPPSALGYESQDIEEVEDDTSEITENLEDTYARMLLSIPPSYVSYTRTMLQWLCFCSRPMRLEELVEATAFDQGDLPNIEHQKLEDILQLCGSLVENQAGTWKSHQPVRQYLVSDAAPSSYLMIENSADGSIAKTCLLYILKLHKIPTTREQAFRQYPLLEYALKEWPGHYRKVPRCKDLEDIDEIAYQLVANEPLFDTWLRWSGLVNDEDMACPAVYHMSLLGILGVIAKLLGNGMFPDAQPEGQYGYALGAACHSGYHDVVRLLLNRGADANHVSSNETRTQSCTPLLMAVDGDNVEILRTLIDFGADVYFGGPRADAPLLRSLGVWVQNVEIVKVLLDHGADVNVRSNDKSETPLHKAANYGDNEIVFLQLLLEYGANPNSRNENSDTPLHYAAHWGSDIISRMLLDAGADINAANLEGLTPFDAALQGESWGGKKRVIKLLVDYGFDVNALYGKHGTRLQKAARSGDEEAVKILLEVGADANLFRAPVPWPHYEPGSPLQEVIGIAAIGKGPEETGNEDIVRMLLKAGADVNFRGAGSGTPLQWAAGAGNSRIVEMLLDAGADVHAFARNDDSALSIAASLGHEKVVCLLLDRGADPNRSNGHLSALGIASRKKFTTIKKMLREHGAVE